MERVSSKPSVTPSDFSPRSFVTNSIFRSSFLVGNIVPHVDTILMIAPFARSLVAGRCLMSLTKLKRRNLSGRSSISDHEESENRGQKKKEHFGPCLKPWSFRRRSIRPKRCTELKVRCPIAQDFSPNNNQTFSPFRDLHPPRLHKESLMSDFSLSQK